MTKEFLDNVENTSKELERIKNRLEKLEQKENTVYTDQVQGSSRSYPYVKHNVKIEGIWMPKDKNLKHKYKKMIKNKKHKLDKLKLQVEYELNYVKDSVIRDIIRYKYIDNKTWLQIMFLMNFKSESTARMKLERFFEKN